MLKFIRPDLLCHPNLPKTLHSISPRVLKGNSWWNKVRQKAYETNDYHCWACGIHKLDAKIRQWLEAHECYDIDYERGKAEMVEIVALCHSCHNFIHSGRLYAITKKGERSKRYACSILEHGLDILHRYELKPFYVAHFAHLVLCRGISEEDALDECEYKGLIPNHTSIAAWEDWHLVIDGKVHRTPYKDIYEWAEKYETNIDKGVLEKRII